MLEARKIQFSSVVPLFSQMNTREILSEYLKIQPIQELVENCQASDQTIFLQGLSGSGGAMVVASVYASMQYPLLLVMPNKEEATYFK